MTTDTERPFREAAVVAVPDEYGGDTVKADVKKTPVSGQLDGLRRAPR
jgi:hypothetical protein